MTDLHEELTGNNYWYIVSNGANIPAEVWIVPPDKMTVIPSKENFISSYLYKVGNQEIYFEPAEIIHFKFPSPTSAYYGCSPFSAIIHAYNINENMNRYESALFKNMARPDGVLQTEQSLNEQEFKRIKKGWNQQYGGVKKTGKTAILEKGLQYKPITFTPRELSFLAGRKLTKEEIFNAFGLPLGLFDKESNRANSEMASYTYMRDTISPRHRRQEQKINEQLMPRYGNGERLFCAYENCVPEDKEFKQKVRSENVNTSITVNEVRREEGKEDVEGGDLLYIDSRMIPLGTQPEAEGGNELEEASKIIAEKVKRKLSV
jgi:HK97 family phage portal protein